MTGTPNPVSENGNGAPAPSPVTPAPGGQVNINSEFQYGSLSRGGAFIPGVMGLWQTGSAVAGVLVLADESGEATSFNLMLAYDSQLGERLRTQRATTFGELAEYLR